jgi:L-malate glycosyltransferase
VLVLVAQITPWKGQETAIVAMPAIRERFPDAHLVLVGDITFADGTTRLDNHGYRRHLEQLVAQLGLERSVTFAGWRPDVADVLHAADLVLQPSWEEPFGRALLEGMASGRPVLATDVGGPAELVRDGIDGRLLPPRSPSAWSAAAVELLGDPEARREMGHDAAEQAGRFGLDVGRRQFAAALAEVLPRPRRSRASARDDEHESVGAE